MRVHSPNHWAGLTKCQGCKASVDPLRSQGDLQKSSRILSPAKSAAAAHGPVVHAHGEVGVKEVNRVVLVLDAEEWVIVDAVELILPVSPVFSLNLIQVLY